MNSNELETSMTASNGIDLGKVEQLQGRDKELTLAILTLARMVVRQARVLEEMSKALAIANESLSPEFDDAGIGVDVRARWLASPDVHVSDISPPQELQHLLDALFPDMEIRVSQNLPPGLAFPDD
ncbi:hypothetical protein WMF37_45545 [Sorangium sp. So ce291]|uniref:hypothetical protein n=1 Tax=Sorangium sp. So ce291 TaxID=3133294 RepID=UPI003F61334C